MQPCPLAKSGCASVRNKSTTFSLPFLGTTESKKIVGYFCGSRAEGLAPKYWSDDRLMLWGGPKPLHQGSLPLVGGDFRLRRASRRDRARLDAQRVLYITL